MATKATLEVEVKPTLNAGALDEVLKGAGDRVKKLFDFNQFQQGAVTAAASLQAFTQPFAQLDKQVNNIGTLGVKNFKDFADTAIDLSTTVPDSAANIAGGIYDAISAGAIKVVDGNVNIAESTGFVVQAAKLGVAGLSDTGASVQLLSASLNAYQEGTDQAAKYSDILFNTVNAGVTTIPQLSSSLSQVVPIAAAFGVSFDQVTAAIATMTKQGVPTATAATQMKGAIAELAKPGAPLAAVMKKAGVSLATLKQDGLQATLAKLGGTMEGLGLSATQVFGSVDAAGAVLALTGKNAQGAAADLEYVRDTVGSTDAAFAIANEGIEVKSNILFNKVQAGFSKMFQVVGTGAITAVNSISTIAPSLTGLAALKNVFPTEIFGNAAKSALSFSQGIASKLVPGIAAIGPASFTSLGGVKALFTTMLLGPPPIGAIIAAIAGIAIGLHFLSDALNDTAAEKLEDAKADEELLNRQKQMADSQQARLSGTVGLIDQYKNLAANTNRTAEEEAKLRDVTNQLNAQFPGAISGSRSFEENLKALSNQSKGTSDEIVKLGGESLKISQQLANNQRLQLSLAVDVSKEELENQLTDVFDVSIVEGWNKAAKLAEQGDLGGSLQQMAKNVLDPLQLGNTVSEFLFGTSDARKDAEAFTKKYSDAIYKSKNAGDVTKAMADFSAGLAIDADKLGLTKAEQVKLVGQFQKVAEAREAEIAKTAEIDKKVTEESAATIVRTFKATTQAGKSTQDAVKGIATAFGVSEEKAKQLVIVDALKATATDAQSADKAVSEVAKKFGVSEEEARKLYETQVKQKDKATEVKNVVDSIAGGFSAAAKAASEGFNKALQDSLDYGLAIKKAQKEGNAAEVARLTSLRAQSREQARSADREADTITALEEAEKKRYANAKVELKDYADAIEKTRRETAALEGSLNVASIADVKERARKEQEARNAAAEQGVLDEIDNAKKAKDISQAQRIQLESALTDKLNSVKKQGLAKLQEIENAARAEALKEELLAEQKRLQDVEVQLKIRSVKLSETEASTADERIQRIRDVSQIELETIKNDAALKVETAILANDRVKAATNELLNATKTGNVELVQSAKTALAEARLASLADPAVRQAVLDEQTRTNAIIVKTSEDAELLTIQLKKEGAERERDLAVFEARKTYKARLEEVRGNLALEQEAFIEFLGKKQQAEETFNQETNEAYKFFARLRKSFVDAVNSDDAEAKRKAAEETFKTSTEALDKEEAELLASLKTKAENYQSYNDKLGDIDRKRAEAKKQFEAEAGADLLVVLQAAVVESLNASALGFKESMAKVADDYGKLLSSTEAKEEDLASKRDELFSGTAQSALYQLTAFAASGELTLAKFGTVVIDAAFTLLQSQIPIWVAGIFGTTVATLGLAGLAVAGGLTAALYGLVAVAKSAIGRKDGEIRAKGPGTRRSDDIPRMISVDESIITAEATLAGDNEAVLRWANRTGRPIREYFKDRGSVAVVKSIQQTNDTSTQLVALTMLTQKNGEELAGIRKSVSRSNFGERKLTHEHSFNKQAFFDSVEFEESKIIARV